MGFLDGGDGVGVLFSEGGGWGVGFYFFGGFWWRGEGEGGLVD